MKYILIALLPYLILSEGLTALGPQTYNMGSNLILELNNVNQQNQIHKVTSKFLLYMHGGITSQIYIGSNSFLYISSGDQEFFRMEIAYSADNTMTDLHVDAADDKITIHYKGRAANSSAIEWYVIFFSGGVNKFQTEIVSSAGRQSGLFHKRYRYQQMVNTPSLYVTCQTNCWKCLDGCKGVSQCARCTECFVQVTDEKSCMNWVVFTIVFIAVFGGIFTIIFLGICCFACCRVCGCDCNIGDCCSNLCSCIGSCCGSICSCVYKVLTCQPCRRSMYERELERQKEMKTMEEKQGIQKKKAEQQRKLDEEAKKNSAIYPTLAQTSAHNLYDGNKEAICNICLKNEPEVTLGCGHTFHQNCFAMWVKNSPDCPQCSKGSQKKLPKIL